MRRLIRPPAALLGATLAMLLAMLLIGLALAVGMGGLFPGPAAGAKAPAGNTIVDVDGNKLEGFTIHYYDGTADHPPTAAEAKADCRERETKVGRVRCRTEARTRFRDLREMKHALDWANGAP